MFGALNYFEEEEEAPKMAVFFLKMLLLFSLCEAEFNEISQPVSVQTLKLRESAAIECNMKSTALKTVWYKLTAGRRLHAVATVDNRNNRSVVADEFQKRFSVEFDSISNRLIISATSWDDVGTYFCGEMHRDKVQFGSGTFLFLKGLKLSSDSVAQQPETRSVQPGESVTISCTVQGGQCSAGHTAVMWLKNLHASPADIIYSSGDKTNSCKRAGSGETCVHRLFLKNMDSDDAGMYHCVVTACGHVMLGTGTRIIHNDLTSQSIFTVDPNAAIFISSVILTICALGVYLGSLVWIIEETNCCFGSCAGLSAPFTTPAEVQHEDHVQTNLSARQKNSIWTECVYVNAEKLN